MIFSLSAACSHRQLEDAADGFGFGEEGGREGEGRVATSSHPNSNPQFCGKITKKQREKKRPPGEGRGANPNPKLVTSLGDGGER